MVKVIKNDHLTSQGSRIQFNCQFTTDFNSPDSIMTTVPIYDTLCKLADGTLQHFVEDLSIHDRRHLEKIQVDSTWLWIVHRSGTHMARWDEDFYAGSKDSHLECLIRAGLFGNWPDHKAFLIHIVHKNESMSPGVFGTINKVSLHTLQTKLPRPKPQVELPNIKRQQQVLSAAVGFSYL